MTSSARSRIVRAIPSALLIGVIAFAAVSVWRFVASVDGDLENTAAEHGDFASHLARQEPDEPVRILLVGLDQRPGFSQMRTDTLILMQVDETTGQVWLVSLPRDTRVEIPGHDAGKINSAYSVGGPALLIDTVESLLELPVNHYLELDFQGFQAIVDEIGGVWIDVPNDIDDPKAADGSPGCRASTIPAGYQLLDGEHALTFVRTRQYPDADFTRMSTQRIFLAALKDELTKRGTLRELPGVVRTAARFLVTDLRSADVVRLMWHLRSTGAEKMYSATLPGEWISPYVELKEQEASEMLSALKTLQPIGPAAHEVTITVANCTGREGLGVEAAKLLEQAGYRVERMGDASWAESPETLVVYEGSDRYQAEAIAQALPSARIVENHNEYSFSTRILVMVGGDWPLAPVIEQ